MSAFDGLDPGAAMTRLNPTPTCDFGHGEMGTDLELDQDGEPTGKLLWTCQVCCWSLPRGNIRWADQSGTPAGALVVCRACGKNPAIVGGGLNGRGLCIVCRHPGKRKSAFNDLEPDQEPSNA